MVKSKNKGIWLWIIIIIISIIGFILFITLHFNKLSNTVNGCEKLQLSDWLTTACAIITLIGTCLLSLVSIYQTKKANDINERLFALNDELQKITDYQAKLNNQENFPILCANNIDFTLQDIHALESELSVATGDIDYFSRSDYYQCLNYYADYRKDKEKETCKNLTLSFDLQNKSNAKISKFRIINFDFKNPLTFAPEPNIENKIILQKEDIIKCKFFFYFDDDFEEDRVNMLNVKLTMEITLVTGIVFNEEMRLTKSDFAEPGYIIETLMPQ